MPHNKQKKIAVINDFCGFGRCSLSVSLPIISALGVQCCPIPTAIFSNHTGYDSFFYTDYTEHMESYMKEWEKLNLTFRGILTGFLGSKEQIDLVLNFMKRFKRDGCVAVVDPVMGDYGSLYPTYSPDLARRMAELLPYADILTPNLTEACILTETEYQKNPDAKTLSAICEKLSRLGPKKIVLSGLEDGDDLENYIWEEGYEPRIIREHKVGSFRSGTGDVFSSIIAADTVNGIALFDAVKHAASFIAKVLRKTVKMEIPLTDGLCIEEYLTEIKPQNAKSEESL